MAAKEKENRKKEKDPSYFKSVDFSMRYNIKCYTFALFRPKQYALKQLIYICLCMTCLNMMTFI